MTHAEKKKPVLVVSTGAGISAESGITTFRDAGGLWENYPVMQVASADGFRRDPELVHEFYNARRRDLLKAKPNAAHLALVELEKDYDVYVITQNVDDLHERAGSSNVLHLHGELMKIRSVKNPDYIESLDIDHLETNPATRGRNGDPMRPHIVFFQEPVRESHRACGTCRCVCGDRHLVGGLSRSRADTVCASRSPDLLHRSEPGVDCRRA